MILLVLYQLLFPLLALGVSLKMLFSGRVLALRESLADIRQRLGLLSAQELKTVTGGRTVWFHAASLGEVAAVAPLLEALAQGENRPRIVLSTSTVTGRNRAGLMKAVDLAVLAPMDFYPAVCAFLSRLRPEALILVETELWPMTLWTAHRRGLRLGLVNGRITERAFSRYLWLRSWMADFLAPFERVAAQSEADARRFAALGVRPGALANAGNMKYDARLPPESELAQNRRLLGAIGWQGLPVWAAGSTRPGEEESVLDAHLRLAVRIPTARLILAPRHPERSQEIAELLRLRRISFVLWSDLLEQRFPSFEKPLCVLVDRLGALCALYGACDAAFVGGTLVPIGGHNLLEPALLAKPVLFGPHTDSIREVSEALESAQGGWRVRDAQTLAASLRRLLEDANLRAQMGQNALTATHSYAGAASRTLRHLRPLLSS